MAVTLQMLETFLRQSPPRQVPPDIRKKALQRAPHVVLVLGLIILLVSGLLVGVFFPKRLPDDIRLSRRGQRTLGSVTGVTRTSYSENDRRVLLYRFQYEAAGGLYHGACYSPSVRLEDGAQATVVYLPEKPNVARIEGCRLSPFGWGAAGVVIMPMIGAAMYAFTRRSRKRIQALLTHGLFAVGHISEIKDTLMQVNKQPVYRVVVKFKTSFGQEAVAHYHVIGNEAVVLPREKMNNLSPVGVLYNVTDPKRVLLVDNLLG